MWKLTYKWANWTHPHKGKRWIVRKYFGRFDQLSTRVSELIEAIPAAQGVHADGTTGPGAGTGPRRPGAARSGPAG